MSAVPARTPVVDWPEPTTDDVVLILGRAGRPMSEDEVIEAWQLLVVERLLEEAVSDGDLERIVEPDGGVSYRWNRPGSVRHKLISRRWAEGRTMRQIAAELGTTKNTLSVEMWRMRGQGWDLPKRPPGGLKPATSVPTHSGEVVETPYRRALRALDADVEQTPYTRALRALDAAGVA